MSKKNKNPEQPAVNPNDDGELPNFLFMGTDGEYYTIGETPHEFVVLLKETGASQLDFDYEVLDSWIWLHLKCVEGQRHLTQHDTVKLYFQCDVPHILDLIFKRLDAVKWSTGEALKLVGDRISKMIRQGNEKENGNIRQERKRRPSKAKQER